MAPLERDNSLRVRMSDDEVNMLKVLADEAGLTASDIVRTLIRERYASKYGDKKPPRPKK